MAEPSAERHVRLASTDDDVLRCWPVMAQLRGHLDRDGFAGQVARQRGVGYQLAFLEDDGAVRAVAGFRIMETLVSGLHMYVDDLVTDAGARSGGYGGQLLEWLAERARSNGCAELQLDSGVQRGDAHRFYHAHRMTISAYHFRLKLRDD